MKWLNNKIMKIQELEKTIIFSYVDLVTVAEPGSLLRHSF